MADKVTALTSNTAPLTTDIMYIVDDPGGTPLSQKITISDLFGTSLLTSLGIPHVVASSSPSAAATVDFSLPSGFTEFEVRGWLQAATDTVTLQLLVSDDGGSTFDNTNEYDYSYDVRYTGGTVHNAGANAAAAINMIDDDIGNASDERVRLSMSISGALEGLQTMFSYHGMSTDDAGVIGRVIGAGRHLGTTALTDIRFRFSSGNIADGELVLIGVP